MALVHKIMDLRADCIRSLDAGHNYHFHTNALWRLVQQMSREGRKFTIRNKNTGKTVDEAELSSLAQGYVTNYLVSATFQHFVSLFERFVIDLLGLWLTEYPASLSAKQLNFQTILDSPDKSTVVAAVVQNEVHELMYGRVADWFDYLEKIAKLGCPNKDQIERLAEIKASRDILVHNNGIANSIYVNKSMGWARFADGDKLELPESYHRESWQLIKQVMNDVSDAAINKLGN